MPELFDHLLYLALDTTARCGELVSLGVLRGCDLLADEALERVSALVDNQAHIRRTLFKARKLLEGASWLYGAQMITVLIQFFYAALTSRLVNADGFGAYAAALTVIGLASLLAMGGLGQSVARMKGLNHLEIRALVTYAILLGSVSACFLLFSGPFWAWLWGIERLVDPLRWLSISALISPCLGLATGLAARLGNFRKVALLTLLSNVIGMGVGAIAVLYWRSAASLTVSVVVAQIITLVLLGCFATDGLLRGVSSLRNGRSVIGFSTRITGTSFLSYLTGNLVKLSLARQLDGAVLGQLNRAEVLTSIPMQQMQSALIRSIYPEFRHDIDDSARARRVWTDMMILVTWAALGVSAFLFIAVPLLVPILFGDGWETASLLVGPLAVASGIQIISTLMASAIEALGRFRWIIIIELVLILLQVLGIGWVILTQDPLAVVYILILTGIVRHGIQIFFLAGEGYIDAPKLLNNYVFAIVFAIVLALWFSLLLQMIFGSYPLTLQLAALAALCALFITTLGLTWKHLPPVQIAKSYGIL